MTLPLERFNDAESDIGNATGLDRATQPLLRPNELSSLANDLPVWRVFALQKDAFAYLQCRVASEHLKVFALETATSSNAGGGCARRYLVDSAKHFWPCYSGLSDELRHCYELIREDRPCRLYFDLEFDRDVNPDMPDEQCVAKFVEWVRRSLNCLMGIVLPDGCVVDLESSTEHKFSRHLIFHMPDSALFKNNQQVGCFVKDMCALLRNVGEEQRRVDGWDCLFVVAKDGRATLICDEGVYSRNRTFGLFNSSKLGQNNPLRLAKSCNFYAVKGKTVPTDEDIFYDSLIEVVDHNHAPVLVYNDNSATEATSRCPLADVRRAEREAIDEGVDTPLPFPMLDSFFRDYLKAQNGRARIRRWVHFKSANLLTLNIANYRYCHSMSREHRSNHIMYVVDLKRRVFYQKCHGPDCRAVDYRSKDFPLPRDLCFEV